jgi:Zn-dependent alcohol dehydrogenase
MKALVVDTLGRGFEVEDVDIAAPIGREVLVHVQASGLCHTDLLSFRCRRCLVTRSPGSCLQSVPT